MTSPFCVYIASVNTDGYSHFLLKMMTKQVSAMIYWTISIEEQTHYWFGMYSVTKHFQNNKLHSQILDFIIISYSVFIFLSLSKSCITFKFKVGKSHLSIISTWPNFIISSKIIYQWLYSRYLFSSIEQITKI